jgi:hypothetical protein
VTPAEEAGTVLSPYVINNHTGIPVTLKLDNAFEVSVSLPVLFNQALLS